MTDAVQFEGAEAHRPDAQRTLLRAIRSVDPKFDQGYRPSWVVTSQTFDDGRSVFVAHSVRRSWTTVDYSPQALAHRVRVGFPTRR